MARNLSRGGALLRLSESVILGAPVRVTLNLRRRTQLSLMGKAAWVRPIQDLPGWEMGIQFDEDLPEELVLEIAEEENRSNPLAVH